MFLALRTGLCCGALRRRAPCGAPGAPLLGGGGGGAVQQRWATNLGGGSTRNGSDSIGKRLGIKLGNGARASKNDIIVRQRGYRYWPGQNVGPAPSWG